MRKYPLTQMSYGKVEKAVTYYQSRIKTSLTSNSETIQSESAVVCIHPGVTPSFQPRAVPSHRPLLCQKYCIAPVTALLPFDDGGSRHHPGPTCDMLFPSGLHAFDQHRCRALSRVKVRSFTANTCEISRRSSSGTDFDQSVRPWTH